MEALLLILTDTFSTIVSAPGSMGRKQSTEATRFELEMEGKCHMGPPAMPRDRVEIRQEALRQSFRDPAFFKEYRKVSGESESTHA